VGLRGVALRRAGSPSPSPTQIITAYRDSPRAALPIGNEDPHLGPLDAPVQLVVFASFECPACRAFAPTLSRLHTEFGDRLLVAFKHYPLSSRCNERSAADKQPGSCEIAWAAEAANRQGRFWPFHDAIFAALEGAAAGTAERVGREIGLDPQWFEADRRSAATYDRVAADIALGTRLRIPGTPAVFLDGRLVHRADQETLEILIRGQLGEGPEPCGPTQPSELLRMRPDPKIRPSPRRLSPDNRTAP